MNFRVRFFRFYIFVLVILKSGITFQKKKKRKIEKKVKRKEKVKKERRGIEREGLI